MWTKARVDLDKRRIVAFRPAPDFHPVFKSIGLEEENDWFNGC